MIDERIIKFIRKHHVLTLAVGNGDAGWVAHAFYAFSEGRLVFSTSPDTEHGKLMAANPQVSFGMVLETRVVGRVQGLQGTGDVARADDTARKAYLKRFPYAVAIPDLTLWTIEPTRLKFTDNTLGFGKKLIWTREE